jgi:23S rRNA (cytidine2498-2'-O)-methyltransferase
MTGMTPFDDAASPQLTGYLAAEGFLEPLLEELGPDVEVHDRLVLAPGPVRPAAWAQNIWPNVERIPIASIKEGARALKARQRNWGLWPLAHFRRAQLIQDLLPHVGIKPITFPTPVPTAPFGSWTLLEPDLILASAQGSSPFRHGEARFVENREAPPNRAYLKLWEALTVARRYPGPGDRCLDLGASPGGWTWVLQQLGAEVLSIDKAPLDPAIAALPRVTQLQQSAFALKPEAVGPIDFLCSDVICYPARLLRLVETWLASGLVRNFICTIKFQAETDHETARAFAAIPGSRVQHLFHNKHELTWIKLED